LIYGNVFHWIFAGLLVPPSWRSNSSPIAAQHAARCVVSSRDMSLLAKRFDTAINNMPHGL